MSRLEKEQLSELDQLIKNTEFENSVQDKTIYDEREKIAAYERELTQQSEEINRMEKEIMKNHELTLKYSHKIAQSKENYESLKKTSVVLDEHIEALSKKVDTTKQFTAEQREKQLVAIEKYTLIWEEYKKRYESSESAQKYLSLCNEVKSLETEVDRLEIEVEKASKQLHQEGTDPVIKLQPWLVEFAQNGAQYNQLLLTKSQLDETNRSLLCEIEQIREDIDNKREDLEASSSDKEPDPVSESTPPLPPPPAFKKPRLAPSASWSNKLKMITNSGSSVKTNNPRPSFANPLPPAAISPRPVSNISRPSIKSGPITPKLTVASRASVSSGSLIKRLQTMPRPSQIHSISKPPPAAPQMITRPSNIEIPSVGSGPDLAIETPPNISGPLATVSNPVLRPLAADIPVSRPLSSNVPGPSVAANNDSTRPSETDEPVEQVVSMDTSEPVVSMETLELGLSMERGRLDGGDDNLIFTLNEEQVEERRDEEEEREREDERLDQCGIGAVLGDGGYGGFFTEMGTNSNLFAPPMPGTGTDPLTNDVTNDYNFDFLQGFQSNMEGGRGGSGGGDAFAFLDSPAKTTNGAAFDFLSGGGGSSVASNTNTAWW